MYKERNLSTYVSILSYNVPVFISADDANNVIKRQRRASSLLLEEVLQGSLERECLEERCTEEEAREVFENDEMLVSILFSCVHNKNYCLGPLLSNTDPEPASFVSDSLHVKSLHFPPQQVESRCPQWSKWKCRGQLWHFCSSLLTMMSPAAYIAKVYGCCPILTTRRNTASASLRNEEGMLEWREARHRQVVGPVDRVLLGQWLQVPSYKRPSYYSFLRNNKISRLQTASHLIQILLAGQNL